MTDRTAIRLGFLLNALGFLGASVALSIGGVTWAGLLGTLTMAISAVGYSLQETVEAASEKAEQLEAGGHFAPVVDVELERAERAHAAAAALVPVSQAFAAGTLFALILHVF